jgi:hypothetical protein
MECTRHGPMTNIMTGDDAFGRRDGGQGDGSDHYQSHLMTCCNAKTSSHR